MKQIILVIALLTSALWPLTSARAAGTNPVYTAAITVTNTATNGQSLLFQGATYRWTNSSSPTIGWISTTNSAAATATNLFKRLSRDYTNTLRFNFTAANRIQAVTLLGGSLSVSGGTGWMTNLLTTNFVTAGSTSASLSASNLNAVFSLTLAGTSLTNWSDLGAASIPDGSITTNKMSAAAHAAYIGGGGGGDISTASSNNIIAAQVAGDAAVSNAVLSAKTTGDTVVSNAMLTAMASIGSNSTNWTTYNRTNIGTNLSYPREIFINVKDYGAAGLGADYTTQLQAALDQTTNVVWTGEVWSAPRYIVFIPAGSYWISTNLYVGGTDTHIMGGGEGKTYLVQLSQGCSGFKLKSSFGNMDGSAKHRGIRFSELTMNLAYTYPVISSSVAAFDLTTLTPGSSGASRVTIENCTARNWKHGIKAVNVIGLTVRQCDFECNFGVWLQGVDDCELNSVFTGTYGNGWQVGGTNAWGMAYSAGVVVTNDTGKPGFSTKIVGGESGNVTYGYDLQGTGTVIIEGTHWEANGMAVVRVGSNPGSVILNGITAQAGATNILDIAAGAAIKVTSSTFNTFGDVATVLLRGSGDRFRYLGGQDLNVTNIADAKGWTQNANAGHNYWPVVTNFGSLHVTNVLSAPTIVSGTLRITNSITGGAVDIISSNAALALSASTVLSAGTFESLTNRSTNAYFGTLNAMMATNQTLVAPKIQSSDYRSYTDVPWAAVGSSLIFYDTNETIRLTILPGGNTTFRDSGQTIRAEISTSGLLATTAAFTNAFFGTVVSGTNQTGFFTNSGHSDLTTVTVRGHTTNAAAFQQVWTNTSIFRPISVGSGASGFTILSQPGTRMFALQRPDFTDAFEVVSITHSHFPGTLRVGGVLTNVSGISSSLSNGLALVTITTPFTNNYGRNWTVYASGTAIAIVKNGTTINGSITGTVPVKVKPTEIMTFTGGTAVGEPE